jgi:hypothetical protein
MSTQTTAPTNLTPKQRFQLQALAINEHRDMVVSRPYQSSVDFGLLEYVNELADDVKDGNSAAAVGFKLQGAVSIIRTMKSLSETPQVTKTFKPETINYNVK